MLLELLADQPLRQLEEAADLGPTSAVSSVWFSPVDSNPEAPWNGIGPIVTLNPTVLGGSQIVISRVDSILGPKNLLTESWVDPTPDGPSDVQWEDSVSPCQWHRWRGQLHS